MKKQLILISLVCSTFLLATESFVNPLPVSNRSTDTGGTLPAIDAYSDGVGAVVLDNLRSVDNSAMNSLVYTYGVEAKTNNLTIADQVLLSGTESDIAKAGVFFVDGASCVDNNLLTVGETWLNGVCQGGTLLHPNGESCTDNNIMTINDVYSNGVCSGTLTVNGQTCSDGNSATTGETWLNGICQGGYIANNTCSGGFSGNVIGNISCHTGTISSLDKFSGLTDVFGNLALYNNTSLTNVNGLSNLKTVNGYLWLHMDNTALNDLSGLQNLTYIKDWVTFDNRSFNIKMPATSYLCQNYSTKIYFSGTGYATAVTKSKVCY